MLTKKQLEDAAECPQNGLCTKCEMDCVRTLYNGYFDGCISEAAQTALAYRDMLERLEWSNRIPLMNYLPVYEHHCPLCGWPEFNGHAPNCELGNMLKGLEGESC